MTLAIVGMLMVIATANFAAMQYRAKRAELLPNVDGIKATLTAHLATFDSFEDQLTYHPTETPGKEMMEWTTCSAFDDLGWRPDGNIRGAYKMQAEGLNFRVSGISDVDGDGVRATFTATREMNAFRVTHDMIY